MENFLQQISQQLKSAGIENPMLEARMILAHILQKEMSEIYFSGFKLTPKQEQEAKSIVQKRILHWDHNQKD